MLCIVSILIAGCGTTPEIQPENTWANAQIANPASENCIAKGGNLEIKDSEDGQTGIYKFDDGSSCEEWSFYRGECSTGATENNKK